MKKTIFAIFICFALTSFATPQATKIFKFDDYWKDGEDGLAAMSKIIDEVKQQKGTPCQIEFSKREYLFPKSKNHGRLFLIKNVENLKIEGNGAKISIDAYNSFCEVFESKNITIANMDTTYTTPPFTQGDVIAIDKGKGFFILKIHDTYPLLPSDEFTKRVHPEGWRWGSVMDKKTRTIKRGTIDAVFIEKVEATKDKSAFALYPEKRSMAVFKTLEIGDAFAMPVYGEKNPHLRYGGGAHLTTSRSSNVLFENIRCSGLKLMGFGGSVNHGRYTFRNCTLTWKRDTDLISCWRDGSHFKNNRYGPIIENCRFEGMLDDSINISTAPARVIEVLGENRYKVDRGESIFAGCTLGIYYADSGKWIEGIKVVSKKGNVIETDYPIKDLVLWQIVSAADIANSTAAVKKNASLTGLYNLEYLGAEYKIKNNYFGKQRRFAMVIRAPKGEISGNTFDSLPGGIWVSNEIGGWYEGAIPHNIKIKKNTFKNIWRTPIIINMMSTSGAHIPEMKDIKVYSNNFELSELQRAVEVLNGKDMKFKGNTFKSPDGELEVTDAVLVSPKAKDIKLIK